MAALSSRVQVARLTSPNIWDVAGGLALVRATGREVRRHGGDAWVPMESSTPIRGANDIEDLRHWHGGLVVGTS